MYSYTGDKYKFCEDCGAEIPKRIRFKTIYCAKCKQRYRAKAYAQEKAKIKKLKPKQHKEKIIKTYKKLLSKVINNFWKNVQKTDTCWLYGSISENKYGKVCFLGKYYGAHVFSYKLANNVPIEDKLSLYVLHTCDIPKCVNPAHLYLGTAKNNSDDKYARGRDTKASAKLNIDIVKTIRNLHGNGMSSYDLAIAYNVSYTTIYRIVTYKIWK